MAKCNISKACNVTGFAPYSLLCERLVDPVAVDNNFPGFSWKACHGERGQFQSSYRVVVSSSKEKLQAGDFDIWDSGQCESGQSLDTTYSGSALVSMRDYFWKVILWDSNGTQSCWSDPATFGMGLLPPDKWEADWIAYPRPGKDAIMFRRDITIRHPVHRAKLILSGLGYYELSINGQKIGDHLLDPTWTDYSKRVCYVGYDVVENLKNGENTIGVLLGKGWFGSPWFGHASRPSQLLLQLLIVYDNGEEEIIVSNRNSGWLVSNIGPVRDNSIYNGEQYDARLEQPGWDNPAFQPGADWVKPIIVDSPGGIIISQALEPIKAVLEIKPVSITNPAKGIYVVDLGQNISGFIGIKNINEEAGRVITLKPAEVIHTNGLVNCDNLRIPIFDTYICGNSPDASYVPRFTYHGFRYVQIEGMDTSPSLDDVTGYHVRSAVDQIGRFNCSNALINQIHKCIVWTESDNLHGVPTDCPQRDERLGWLNDMTPRTEEAVYNFNLDRLYAKWIDDIHDTQDCLGAITDTAPFMSFGRKPACPVCSSYILIPWLIYVHYGDASVIEKHFDNLMAWNNYLALNSSDYIIEYSSWGDWASPMGGSVEGSAGASAVSAITPGDLMSTGYFYYNNILLGKMASMLERQAEEIKLRETAEKIKDAFNAKYLNAEEGVYAEGSQASQVFPLFLRIVPEECVSKVLDNLVLDIKERGVHITTGNQCTKYLIEMLTQYGYGDLALELVTQTTYPSWGYMIDNGATTIWERWEYIDSGPYCEMASHNHPMNGVIGAWFYKYMAGIVAMEEYPGFERFILEPYFLKGIDHAGASLETCRGLIVSAWSRDSNIITYDVEVPFNTDAEIIIKDSGITPQFLTVSESDENIWINAGFQRKQGIFNIEVENGKTSINVGSGVYRFVFIIS